MSLPIFRISASNATLLSGSYLLLASVLELIRRIFSARWADWACVEMEKFPARALEMVGLLDPLKRAYAWGGVADWVVRIVFGLTTVTLIFVLAISVGAVMWLAAKFANRGRGAG